MMLQLSPLSILSIIIVFLSLETFGLTVKDANHVFESTSKPFIGGNGGDFNNDGFDDFLVERNDILYLYYSNQNWPFEFDENDANISFTALGELISQFQFIGDVNGDGFDDMLIASTDNSNNSIGYTYLIYGSNSLPFLNQIESLSSAVGIKFGPFDLVYHIKEDFSSALAGFGDFNGDFIPDFAFSSPNSTFSGRISCGLVNLKFGNLSSNFSDGVVIFGGSYTLSGISLHLKGDFNNDGFSDLLIGIPFNGTQGSIALIFGLSNPPPTIDITAIDGTNGFTLQGYVPLPPSEVVFAQFGFDVAMTDFNGDSFDDLWVSSYSINGDVTPKIRDSSVSLIYGNSFSTTLNGKSIGMMNSSEIIHFVDSFSGGLGRSVSDCGDSNLDGYNDLLVSEPWSDIPNSGAGLCFLIYGTNETDVYLSTVQSPLLLSSLPISLTLPIYGDSNDLENGKSIVGLGDINNDSYADFGCSANINATIFYGGPIQCYNGTEYSNPLCVPCPPQKGYQYVGNCSQKVDFSCSTSEYMVLGENSIWKCNQCPLENSIAEWYTFELDEKCKFDLHSNCPSGSFVSITPGTFFDSVNCQPCPDSTMNHLPNQFFDCKCRNGTTLASDGTCIFGTDSWNVSISGSIFFSVFLGCGLFFLHYSRKRNQQSPFHKILFGSGFPTSQLENTQNTHPFCATLADFSIDINTRTKNPIESAFQAISLFIWLGALKNNSLTSNSFTYPQTINIIDFWKKTPYVPGSKSHLSRGQQFLSYYPYIAGFQIICILFTLNLRWSASIVSEQWSFLGYFVFYFGSDLYLAGVFTSFSIAILLMFFIKKPYFSGLSSLFILSLFFNFFSLFNCVDDFDGSGSGAESSTSQVVALSAGGEKLVCWQGLHISLLLMSILFSLPFILYPLLVRSKQEFHHIPHLLPNLFLLIGYSLFSSPWIHSQYLQLLIILSFCDFYIYIYWKKFSPSIDRDNFIFSFSVAGSIAFFGILSLLIDDPSNLLSGVFLIIVFFLFFFIGIPMLEYQYIKRQNEFFFENPDATAVEMHIIDEPSGYSSSFIRKRPEKKQASPGQTPQQEPQATKATQATQATHAAQYKSHSNPKSSHPTITSSSTLIALFLLFTISFSTILPYQDLEKIQVSVFSGESLRRYGYYLESAGDFNNDGFNDILIGTASSKVQLLFGPFAQGINISVTSVGTEFHGATRLGYAFASGDVNNDGFSDLILTSKTNDIVTYDEGTVFIYYGRNTTLANSIDIDLEYDVKFIGNVSNGELGTSVASCDFNNDGIQDIVIGAPNENTTVDFLPGKVYLVYGSGSLPMNENFSSFDNSSGVIFNGFKNNSLTGYSVANGGDIKKDGFDALLIGAQRASPFDLNLKSGQLYVVYGSNSFISPFNLSLLDGVNGFIINGFSNNARIGQVSASIDFNNDTFLDIVVSGYNLNADGIVDSGQVFVLYGPFSNAPELNLSTVNSSNSLIFNGIGAEDNTGYDLTNSGDVNGDGVDDLLIGSQKSNWGYLVFGGKNLSSSIIQLEPFSPLVPLNIIPLAPISDTVASEWSAQVSGIGDVDQDGYADMLISANLGPDGAQNGEILMIWGRKATQFVYCSTGYYVNPNDGSCSICPNANISGSFNPDSIHNKDFCEFTYWKDCEPLQCMSCPVGTHYVYSSHIPTCKPCPEITGGDYIPEKPDYSETVCTPLCDSNYYLTSSKQCFQCFHFDANPEPNQLSECVRPSYIFEPDYGSSIGYFIGFSSLLGSILFIVLKQKKTFDVFLDTDPQSENESKYHPDKVYPFLNRSTDDLIAFSSNLFDSAMSLIYLFHTDNSIDDSSETPINESFETPIDDAVDTIVSEKSISKNSQFPEIIIQYLLKTPHCFEHSQFYFSKNDFISLSKIIIDLFQLVGLISSLSLVVLSMENSDSLFIFNIFNLNFGSFSFRFTFWLCEFFVALWMILVFGPLLQHKLPFLIHLTSFDYRFVPILGGVFVIPIINTLVSSLICIKVQAQGSNVIYNFVAPSVSIVTNDFSNKIECNSDQHVVLIVFALLGLLSYIPTVIYKLDKVVYLSKTQFIFKPRFIQILVCLKILVTIFSTLFGGYSTIFSLQIISCLSIMSLFVFLIILTRSMKPCVNFHKVDTLRLYTYWFGLLFSTTFFSALIFSANKSIVVTICLFLCFGLFVLGTGKIISGILGVHFRS